MADVHIYHPETQATVAVPEEAVPHLRQAGWLLRSEWDDNQAAAEAATAKSAKSAKSTEEK